MRRSQDFTDAVRGGVRAGARRVVVHLHPSATPLEPARVGLVVSRAVGNAVQRNAAKRRLRGLLNARLSHLHDGEKLVVRALAAARGATSAELGQDLDRALTRARQRARREHR